MFVRSRKFSKSSGKTYAEYNTEMGKLWRFMSVEEKEIFNNQAQAENNSLIKKIIDAAEAVDAEAEAAAEVVV